MLNPALLHATAPRLQHHPWPPVNPADDLDPDLRHLLTLSLPAQRQLLTAWRQTPVRYGRLLHHGLATCFSARYGYPDSPCGLDADDTLMLRLHQAELVLGAELLHHALDPQPIPRGLTQAQAADALHTLAQHNAGVTHPLFDYLATTASRSALETMLWHETWRNASVDDEVACLAMGLQGVMKAVVVSNLWDECGHGKLASFHTYWLRRLLDRLGVWDTAPAARRPLPWWSQIAGNTFNVLLWHPAYRYGAYGFFLITESWVAPHFTALLAGLQRVGLTHPDLTVYFEAHLHIDPHHGAELVSGFQQQVPRLSQHEVEAVLWGAHLAVAASCQQYEALLEELVQGEAGAAHAALAY